MTDDGWVETSSKRKKKAKRDPLAPPKRTDNRFSDESARDLQATYPGGKIAGLARALTSDPIVEHLKSGWVFGKVLRGGSQDTEDFTGYETREFPIPSNGYGDVIVLLWKKA